MYHVEMIDVHKGDTLFAYCDFATACAKNMFNVANYYIRNTMTALGKGAASITSNEKEVLDTVMRSIPEINAGNAEKYEAKKLAILNDGTLSPEEREEKARALKLTQFKEPTDKQWFLGYRLLDALFKHTNNVDYRAHHVHTMQNAVADCVEAWKSYFELQRNYKRDPAAFTGAPKIPRYCNSGNRTAVFSNIGCKVKNGNLHFPSKEKSVVLDVSSLPHAFKDKLIEVRIVPRFGMFRIQIVTDDGIEDPYGGEAGATVEIIPGEGVMMLDPGLANFATLVDNKGFAPIVIKGGYIKTRNQWFNKQMAKLRGIQMEGHDPKEKHFPTTSRMCALSRKRDAFLRDAFYKTAHYIFRMMRERDEAVLVVGRSIGWKQGINIGRKNNQEFVQVPFAKFINTLKTVSREYEITVIDQNESYTSKASFLDNDPIPDYDPNSEESCVFSGKRIHRGLYRAKGGTLLNADVNGSANIGRKCSANVFFGVTDFSYLTKTVLAVNFQQFYKLKSSPCQKG